MAQIALLGADSSSNLLTMNKYSECWAMLLNVIYKFIKWSKVYGQTKTK